MHLGFAGLQTDGLVFPERAETGDVRLNLSTVFTEEQVERYGDLGFNTSSGGFLRA
jgi:hypothetical protein